MVVPTNEFGVDPLGIIAELPVGEKNPGGSANPPTTTEWNTAQPSKPERRTSDADNHVMSWAQFNSLGNRGPAARLSQPYGAPVWENMTTTRSERDEGNDNEASGSGKSLVRLGKSADLS